MKKLLIIFLLAAVAMYSCDDFLNTENLVARNSGNYPKLESDALELLTGLYSATRAMEMDQNGACAFIVSEILSDDRFAGGGPDDAHYANLERFASNNLDMFRDTWTNAYTAIYRANVLLKGIEQVEWTTDGLRSDIEGQTYFMRAYAYFYLARLFGTAPLVLTTEQVNYPKASADEMFGQIAADLKKAIELLPNVPGTSVERGRATRWAAQALLARAFLFYTGYYGRESIALPDGSAVTKANVTGWLDDCIKNSGHNLYTESKDDEHPGNGFYNLWPYSNKATKDGGYAFSVNNNLNWAGEEGGNYETVFAWQSIAKVGWSNVPDCNRINLYFSIREQDEGGIYPYGKGWGFGTVNSQLWQEWNVNDPRRKGSIIDVQDKTGEMTDFQWAGDRAMHETGYLQKKYIAVNAKDDKGGITAYSRVLYSYGNEIDADYQINNTQDLVMIRFADVLLMYAELADDAYTLNQVRGRVGLDPVDYSLEALKNERRHELAFEGLRYHDLLRWGFRDGSAAAALAKQNGVAVKNNGSDAVMNLGDIAVRLKATGGFVPVPDAEVKLSAGVLEQNQGWK